MKTRLLPKNLDWKLKSKAEYRITFIVIRIYLLFLKFFHASCYNYRDNEINKLMSREGTVGAM